MGYDLHVHTTASDGKVSPAEVVREAVGLKLAGIAITDHDTVEGIIPAQNCIMQEKLDIDLIPGVEFSVDLDQGEVHILGYFIDYMSPQLLEKLALFKEARSERAVKMVKKLNQLGLCVDLDHVRELAVGGLMGRPHIARAMIEKGYVDSLKEAFDRYLGMGRPAYFPRYKLLPQETIAIIKNCGGISVLAHPGHIKELNVVEEMINLGINGLEVFYPDHSEQQTSYFRELARQKRLLITGGSDYHGESIERSNLGSVQLKRVYVDSMKAFRDQSTTVELQAPG